MGAHQRAIMSRASRWSTAPSASGAPRLGSSRNSLLSRGTVDVGPRASDYAQPLPRSRVQRVIQASSNGLWCSFLAHSSDIDDLLEGLDGVLEDWLDRLHDTESSLHIVDLWLHALDGLHLSGDLNEWLSVIESLEDSGGKSFLDVLDGSGLGDGGIGITSGLAGEGR